jgi:hypothetical protein
MEGQIIISIHVDEKLAKLETILFKKDILDLRILQKNMWMKFTIPFTLFLI